MKRHKWYNLVGGELLAHDQHAHIDDQQTVAVRSGAILPLQEPPSKGPITTTHCRPRPLQLLVVPENQQASGELYWDKGDSLNGYQERKYSHVEFSLKNETLTSNVKWWGFGVPSVSNITILGLDRPIRTVSVNGNPDKALFHYDENTKILSIYRIGLTLDKPFTIKWTYESMLLKKFRYNALDFSNVPGLDVNNNTIVGCSGEQCPRND
ncbi:hypothetical protein NE865_03803 [Phthorimaea operculella]|nr:hypothetical protein NE865_03803 [Phthorimaea operculella]